MIIRILLICIMLTSTAAATEVFRDELVETTLDKSLRPKPYVEKYYTDKLVEKTLKGKNFEKPVPNLDYDYSDTDSVVVKLRPKSKISTSGRLRDGDIVKFTVVQNIIYNGKIVLPKNSEVSAVVENISPNDRYGVPANIVISRFHSEILPAKTLDGEINRQGKNNSIWVYPLSYVLMPFFGAGFGTTFIRGGNVNINTSDIIEIYYRPTRFRNNSLNLP